MEFCNIDNHLSDLFGSPLNSIDKCVKLIDDVELLIKNDVLALLSSTQSEQRLVLHETDRFELVLCTWFKTTQRPWHTHPETKCYFKCLAGNLIEKRDNSQKILNEGEHSYIDDSHGGHQVICESTSPSASLHLYLKI